MVGKRHFDMRIALLFDAHMNDLDLVDTNVSALIEYGVSEELTALLAAIEEATLDSDRARYSQKTVYELKRKLLCYNYGSACYEVAHLLAIATHFGDGIIDMFWARQATTGERLKTLTQNWPTSKHLACEDQLSLTIEDKSFDFNWRRANAAAAWTEFFLSMDTLQPALPVLLVPFTQDISAPAIDKLASDLQRATYAFLKAHLQPQNKLREGMQFLMWLREEENDADYHKLLTDDAVTGFWQAHALGERGDYRRFVSVGELAFNIAISLTLGEQKWQLAHAASHSASHEDGNAWIDQLGSGDYAPEEQDLDAFQLHDAVIEAYRSPTEVLGNELAHIKFLTATDLEVAQQLERPPEALATLPFTHLRMCLFGRQQAAITGGLQNQNGKTLTQLITCDAVTSPGDWQQELSLLIEKINATLAATAHLLIKEEQLAGFGVLAGLDRQVATILQSADGTFDGMQTALQQQMPDLLKHCGDQYKKINRQGFKQTPSEEHLPDYIQGAEQLSELLSQHERVGRIIGEYTALFGDDKTFFKQQFQRIYEARL